MKSTVEPLEDNKVKLSVEVDAQEFDVEVDKAFKKIAREVRLPGFRKGKVPRRVLEARFGTGMARGQALEDSIPDYFLSAISDSEVDMISPPEYEIVSGQEEGPLAFDAVIEVRPKYTINGYQDMVVEIPSPEPSVDDTEQRVDSFLGQFAELGEVERPAIDGDTVTVDITTSHDGEEVEGLTANDYSYRLGSGGVVPELDDNLSGAKVGDIFEFDAEHPDPEEDGSLHFRILVKQVQEQVLPDLTDELVADASDFETVDEFRADIEDKLRTAKAAQMDALWREKAADALGALIEDDPPTALVDSEVRHRVEDMARRLAGSGINFETYLQMMGQSVEDLLDQMREPATQGVKIDMALRALAEAEGLEASDADIDAEFEKLAEGSGVSVDDLRTQISTPNQLMLFRADVSKQNAAEWLFEQVQVVDEDGTPVDKAALEPPPEEDHDHEDDDHEDHDHDHKHDEEE